MGFPLKCFAVNHLNTLSNCTNTHGFDLCHLKTSLTVSLDAINCYNSYFCFFVSYTVDDPMLYEATTAHQLSPLSGPLLSQVTEEPSVLRVTSCKQYKSWYQLPMAKLPVTDYTYLVLGLSSSSAKLSGFLHYQ
jgi:hypothetical protein